MNFLSLCFTLPHSASLCLTLLWPASCCFIIILPFSTALSLSHYTPSNFILLHPSSLLPHSSILLSPLISLPPTYCLLSSSLLPCPFFLRCFHFYDLPSIPLLPSFFLPSFLLLISFSLIKLTFSLFITLSPPTSPILTKLTFHISNALPCDTKLLLLSVACMCDCVCLCVCVCH